MDDSGYMEWPSDPTEILKTLEEQVEGRYILEEYAKLCHQHASNGDST